MTPATGTTPAAGERLGGGTPQEKMRWEGWG